MLGSTGRFFIQISETISETVEGKMKNHGRWGVGRFRGWIYIDKYLKEIYDTGEVDPQKFYYIKIKIQDEIFFIHDFYEDKLFFSNRIEDTYNTKIDDEAKVIFLCNKIKEILNNDSGVEAEVNYVQTTRQASTMPPIVKKPKPDPKFIEQMVLKSGVVEKPLINGQKVRNEMDGCIYEVISQFDYLVLSNEKGEEIVLDYYEGLKGKTWTFLDAKIEKQLDEYYAKVADLVAQYLNKTNT
jgi:hypothetical protein